MSGPSRREEQDRRSRQPVTRFSLKGLFNKLTGLLGIRALFNLFARPRGPRPVPIKIDPAWFPVPQPQPAPEYDEYLPPGMVPPKPHLPPWEPPWVQTSAFDAEPAYESPLETEYPDDFDPVAFAEEYPDWDDELPEPHIHVYPDEKVPENAGAFVESYYLIGVGDVLVFERLHPDDPDLHPDQIIESPGLRHSFNLHFRRKGPKPPE